MNDKIIFSLICFFLCSMGIHAQRKIEGNVKDSQTGKNIPFANVILQLQADTTKNYSGSLTDLEGNFSLDNVPTKSYRIVVSYLGYKTIKENIALSDSSRLNRNYSLQPLAVELKETVVTANRNIQHIDHRTITFTSEQIKHAQVGRDLVKDIPEIREDALTGTLKNVDGKAPFILINNVRSSEVDLKALKPSNIKYIEYYDIPPARYATASSVINVVTKTLEKGYSFGLKTRDAFSTGFSDDEFYLSITQGKSKFDLSYDFSLRDYKDVVNSRSYEYTKGMDNYIDKSSGKEKFGYINQDISVKYAYIPNMKSIFQISFEPNILWEHSKSIQNGVYGVLGHKDDITRNSHENIHTFNPSLDLYFDRQFDDKNNLAVNINAATFGTHSTSYEDEEISNGTVPYVDDMRLKNRKNSIIGEIDYSHQFANIKLNTGYHTEFSHSRSNLNNLSGQDVYSTNQSQHYLYAELVGGKGKLMYKANVGVTTLRINSPLASHSEFMFTPKAELGYNVSNNTSLRFELTSNPIIPSLNMLSSNVTMLTRDIYKKGNPHLKNGQDTRVTLMLNHNSKYIDLMMRATYSYQSKAIYQYFYTDNNDLILGYKNCKHVNSYGGFVMLQYKPFGNDLLSFSLVGAPQMEKVYNEDDVNKIFSVDNLFDIDFNYKNFNAHYHLVIPVYTANGSFKSSTENNNDFTASYRVNNWTFSASVFFIGKDAKYITKTNSSSFVNYNEERRIKDNHSMFAIGVEYNFNAGKNKSFTRRLNNRDTDSPTF